MPAGRDRNICPPKAGHKTKKKKHTKSGDIHNDVNDDNDNAHDDGQP